MHQTWLGEQCQCPRIAIVTIGSNPMFACNPPAATPWPERSNSLAPRPGHHRCNYYPRFLPGLVPHFRRLPANPPRKITESKSDCRARVHALEATNQREPTRRRVNGVQTRLTGPTRTLKPFRERTPKAPTTHATRQVCVSEAPFPKQAGGSSWECINTHTVPSSLGQPRLALIDSNFAWIKELSPPS